MENLNWWEVIPAMMSSIAGMAAAVAAFISLKISRDSRNITVQDAVAAHHNSAVLELSDAVSQLRVCTKELSHLAHNIFSGWSREVDLKDDSSKGGKNLRPLRHVLKDAAEMLVNHAELTSTQHRPLHGAIFSIVRNGGPIISEREYQTLLSKGDHRSESSESVFGKPSISEDISDSKAFRWAFSQLTKRVSMDDWSDVWVNACSIEGKLRIFQAKLSEVRPHIGAIKSSLTSEKSKLAHSTFPLELNRSLHSKYEEIIALTNTVLYDCDMDILEAYSNKEFEPDALNLILYSMALIELASRLEGRLCKIEEV